MNTKELRKKIEERIEKIDYLSKHTVYENLWSEACNKSEVTTLNWVLSLLDEEPTDKPEKLQRYVTVDLFAIATQIETLQDRVNWLLEHHD